MSAEINYQVKFKTESETKSYSIGFPGSEKELTEWVNKYYPILIQGFVGIIKIKRNYSKQCRPINYHLFDLVRSYIEFNIINYTNLKLNENVLYLLNSFTESDYDSLTYFCTYPPRKGKIEYYSSNYYFDSVFLRSKLQESINNLKSEINSLIIKDIIQ